MPLKKYQGKRKFDQTSEPKDNSLANEKKIYPVKSCNKIPMDIGRFNGVKSFVVHKHQSSHLHYDFRLEMNGVLKSWAIPKGIPEKQGIKHLAIQVEDHPIDYINFEGEIPEGNYGAGKVKIWDKGTYEIIKQEINKITGEIKLIQIKLNGKKLKGKYVLIFYKQNQWLIQKFIPRLSEYPATWPTSPKQFQLRRLSHKNK
ncbi:MAG: DNA polymerase ligase N-terminal domain-containing protein [Candidatus Kuenenbacteria bacterium]